MIGLFPWLFAVAAFSVLAFAAYKRARLRHALGDPAAMGWRMLWRTQAGDFGPEHEPLRRQIAWRVTSGLALLAMVGVSLAVRHTVCLPLP